MCFPMARADGGTTLTQERFTGRTGYFERTFDGIRLLAFTTGGRRRLFSRNRLPQNIPTSSVDRKPPRCTTPFWTRGDSGGPAGRIPRVRRPVGWMGAM